MGANVFLNAIALDNVNLIPFVKNGHEKAPHLSVRWDLLLLALFRSPETA